MATYPEMVTSVRNWMDRDSTIVSDALIFDFLKYGQDKALKKLRIPPLETKLNFTVTSSDLIADKSGIQTEVKMDLPSNFIQLIYIQKKGTGIVWNHKLDQRSFHDRFSDKPGGNYFTRTGSNILLSGTLSEGDVLEVAYYRTLSIPNAVYSVNAANYKGQTATLKTMTGVAQSYSNPDTNIPAPSALYFHTSITQSVAWEGNVNDVYDSSTGAYSQAYYFEPRYVPNWLRDENERILLYGALAEAFSYLEEPNQMQIYETKFNQEIDELNAEERRRIGSGGNTQMTYSGMGLI